MSRFPRQTTLLQRFTILSAGRTVALAIVLSTATVEAIQGFAVKDEAQVAAEIVLRTIAPQLRPSDFERALPAERRALLDALFKARGISDKILRVRLWRADGRLLYSNIPEAQASLVAAVNLSGPSGFSQFVRSRAPRHLPGSSDRD